MDDRPEARALLANIKAKIQHLEELLERTGRHTLEDAVYRFYHPNRPLNETFTSIVAQGTGKKWAPEHNKRCSTETRPILEAFFHSLYFLKMVVRYGKELKQPPALLPSGWAAVLHLYGLR
jgi:hypothetical protein